MNNNTEDAPLYCILNDSQLPSVKYIQTIRHQPIYQISDDSSVINKNTSQKIESFSGWAVIMKHCRVFCETTSLRGVPRIVKTNEPKRKFLLIFFVTAFFLACITCIVLLIFQYRRYDVIHQPKTLFNQPRPFPSLTMCNLRPLSSYSIKILKEAGLTSITKYLEELKNSMINLKHDLTEIKRKLLTMSWNINSYFLNLPNSINLTELGHSRLEMILMCVLVYKEGIYPSGRSCDTAGRWVSTLNSIFLNCHTFIVDEKYSNRTFNMEIVLYLDNADEFPCQDCLDMMIASQLTGIRLNLHSAGTYPEIIEKGINLMPGTLTELRFIPREWSMMESPHGKCSRTISKKISFNFVDFEYSEEACKKKVLQEELVKQCNCLDFNQIPDNLYHYLYQKKICKYLPASLFSNESLPRLTISRIADYLNKTHCELMVSSKMNYQVSKCNSPCTFFTYDTTISSAEWPTKAYHASFLKSLNIMIKRRINKYQDLENSTKHVWNNIIEELEPYLSLMKKLEKEIDIKKNKKLLKELKFVSDNFLSVQVSRQNFDIILVEEKATVSLTNFLSQIGGIFSIWSGITFFCIVEILELMILIFDEIISKKQCEDSNFSQE